jgi:hypothetical protein
MEVVKSIEIDVLYLTKDYWLIYLKYYLGFNSIFNYFLGFAIFGLLISFLFLGSINFLQLIDLFVAASLFVCLFGIVMSYFAVENAKSLDEGEHKYIFSNEKVEIIAKSFSSQMDWTYFLGVKETGSYFILSMKSGQFNLIPKRYFRDYEQIIDFKNLLQSKLGERSSFKKSTEKLGLK